MGDGVKEGNRQLIEKELWKKLSFGCCIVLLCICSIQFSCWKQLVGKPDWPVRARIICRLLFDFVVSPQRFV